MKFITLFLVSNIISVTVFSQIKVVEEKDKDHTETLIGEIKSAGVFMMKCVLVGWKNGDTTYMFFFNNAKYQQITDVKSFVFNETGGDFEKLYTLIKSTLEAKEKKQIELELKGAKLTLDFQKAMGISSVQFQLYEDNVFSYSSYFTLKQINKLFGKSN